MPRYRLTLEYDGSGFVGWQRQDNGRSVQQALEQAAAHLCRADVAMVAAGRTDAGVHATGQVVHADLPQAYPPDNVRNALNHYLKPEPVAVLAAQVVDDSFHARFSATRRSYLFRILNRRPPPVLERDRVWWVSRVLDHTAMAEAAALLVGHHDFTSFRASECQSRSAEKTLDVLTVTRVGDEVRVVAEARSFLHHQVRNMVGTLALVGRGSWHPSDVARALAARNRAAAGPTAPASGLYLTAVGYGYNPAPIALQCPADGGAVGT